MARNLKAWLFISTYVSANTPPKHEKKVLLFEAHYYEKKGVGNPIVESKGERGSHSEGEQFERPIKQTNESDLLVVQVLVERDFASL